MKKIKCAKPGFTLIELLVAMAVGLVIMGVVLFSYRIFENNLAMKAAARDIAESVKQAQTQGISIKQMASEADFNTGYGVSFNLSDPTEYYIFADANGNGKCDGSATDPTNCAAGAEHLEKDTLPNGVSVSSFCGIDYSGAVLCPPAGAQVLSFVFVSPNQEKPLDATVKFIDGAGNAISGNYTAAEVNLGIPGQVSITQPQSQILISNTGMVYVNPQLVVPATNYPPVVTLNGSSSITVPLGSSFSDPGVTATDQEDGNLTSQVSVSGNVNTSAAGTYNLTYNVTDSGGLSATPATRSVIVVSLPSQCRSKPGGTVCGGGSGCTTVDGLPGTCKNTAPAGNAPMCICAQNTQ